jgi:hypothetical protein
MAVIEDIARDLEPEPASALPTPEAPALPLRQGHRPKLWAAFEAMTAEGLLNTQLRPVAIVRRVTDWLMQAGFADDLPLRDTIMREYRKWLSAK